MSGVVTSADASYDSQRDWNAHAQDFAKFVASQQITAEDQAEDASLNWDEVRVS